MSPTLRERQAGLARAAVMMALLEHLEAGDADQVSMEQLASEAGVSRRTLYRYFPSRDHLLTAAGDWIRSEVLQLPLHVGPEGLTANFLAASARLAKRPALARALLRTETGRALRGTYRHARVESIRKAVRAEAPAAPTQSVKRAAAVISYLCSSNAWTTIQDEAGLDAKAAQSAVVWAIESLLNDLREPNKRKPGGKA